MRGVRVTVQIRPCGTNTSNSTGTQGMMWRAGWNKEEVHAQEEGVRERERRAWAGCGNGVRERTGREVCENDAVFAWSELRNVLLGEVRKCSSVVARRDACA